MCGICGIAYSDPQRPVDLSALTVMRDTLAHRGPDGAGQWMGDGIGFGHRRLSIIDIEGGAQPLSNEDGSVWLTFNGEIYNFQELTRRLVSLGHRFRTRSDTEVLVHAYEEYGLDFVSHLNGMFAFGLYDRSQRRLLIGRDHLGVKPLFYIYGGGRMAFASEIKALRALGEFARQTSQAAVQEYLIFRYNAWDRTFFDGVYRLPPGHLAIWQDGRLALRRYWTPPTVTHGAARSLDEVVGQLDEYLRASVEAQMISEVPLGSFCSGGVDSGLVSNYAARHSPHQLETFSVGFDDPAWDESELVRDTTSRIGTRHYQITAKPDAILDLLPTVIECNDEPLSQPNSAPFYLLSRLARQHVTVVLTGEGADEVFCGYPRFWLARIRGALGGLPTGLLRGFGALCGALPGHRLRRLGDLVPRSLSDVILFNSAFVSPELVSRLTGADLDAALNHRRRLVEETLDPADPLGSVSRYDSVTYLASLLERMDRMLMAHSLEGRVPFLDVPLVEWGLRLPALRRTSKGRPKVPVRRLGERFLSPRITHGRKSGFGLPLADWFRSRRFAPVIRRLTDPSHPAASILDQRFLAGLIRAHMSAQADHSELLWVVTNLFLWLDPTGWDSGSTAADGAGIRGS